MAGFDSVEDTEHLDIQKKEQQDFERIQKVLSVARFPWTSNTLSWATAT